MPIGFTVGHVFFVSVHPTRIPLIFVFMEKIQALRIDGVLCLCGPQAWGSLGGWMGRVEDIKAIVTLCDGGSSFFLGSDMPKFENPDRLFVPGDALCRIFVGDMRTILVVSKVPLSEFVEFKNGLRTYLQEQGVVCENITF